MNQSVLLTGKAKDWKYGRTWETFITSDARDVKGVIVVGPSWETPDNLTVYPFLFTLLPFSLVPSQREVKCVSGVW